MAIWGTQPDNIDDAEDRDKWFNILQRLDIKQPPGVLYPLFPSHISNCNRDCRIFPISSGVSLKPLSVWSNAQLEHLFYSIIS